MPETTARADVRRNRERLLAAAREAIAADGTEASLRDIARRAEVGIGTLYRHFPTREALLEAILDTNFDMLRERADQLLDSPPGAPLEAFLTWLADVAAGARTYQGLPHSIMAALADETSELHGSCAAMRASGGQLLRRAQEAGQVRADVNVYEVITIVIGLAWAVQQDGGSPELMARLLDVAAYGLAVQPVVAAPQVT
ncbi:TetR/AcrR family transcriptional regulator [Micromonospora sp. CPCC 205539]|uniref:TetR/AcrR family transcriptional regulator n=1 Tax=Micromonospora sp. CPCC 205539 TaxID=3122408 RepID=UPI002FEFB61C